MAKPLADDTIEPGARPGPLRPKGAPAGPDAVRTAVIDTAGHLFAKHGVESVTLRDIAGAANVDLALIPRYFGSRDGLIDAVFTHLTVALAEDLLAQPLQQSNFDPDGVTMRWTAILNYFAATGQDLPTEASFNPVEALATVFEREYGIDRTAARLRGAQVVAFSLGWRIFEDYLISWGRLKTIKRQTLHDEVTATARQIGATPWPSPTSPRRRPRVP